MSIEERLRIGRIPSALWHRVHRLEAGISTWWFDRKFGVDTRTPLDRSDLDVANDVRRFAWSYVPCSPARFRRVMRLIPLDPQVTTFVDIGCGKGQLLMLARLMGFARVVGVEFSPALHAAAVRNLDALDGPHPAAPVELLNIDATAYEIPGENCVIFMFNPFQEPVVHKFVEHLRPQLRSRRSVLYLAYVHPTARTIIENCGLFEKYAERGGGTDAVIYRYYDQRQICSLADRIVQPESSFRTLM